MSPTLTLNSTLNTPLGESSGSSSNVPFPYNVAINGRPYLVDLSFQPWKRQAMRTTSIDPNRTQADTSGEPGEATLNPEGLWRRSQDTWNHASSQTNLDRKESDIAMFRTSKGINPWSLWQMTLQYDTRQSYSSANTNLAVAIAGAYLYVSDGTALKYTQDVTVASPSFTATGSTPGVTISSMTSDGNTVYFCVGASGVYMATGAGAAAQLVSSAIDSNAVIGYVNGRLMLGSTNVLYNITSYVSAALPSALMTHHNSAFRWVGFAEGNGWIYAGGFVGSKSAIYAITIAADGSALSAPVIAAELPTGEIIKSIYGYLGFIIIGTNLGFRCAVTVSNPNTNTTPNGTLTIGPLISLPSAVQAFNGQDRFVYFGYSNFDTTSTGIGRMDLTQFPVLPQAPAYASDLMTPSGTTTQGATLSIEYFQNLHVFAVSGQGVYAQHTTNYVPSGYYQSGLITYDIADMKIPMFLDIECLPLVGSVTASLSLDGAPFANLGTFSATGGTFSEFMVSQATCSSAEVQVTLNAPGTPTSTPTLRRTTLRVIPAPVTGNNIFVPIRLHDEWTVGDGTPITSDPVTEWQILEALRVNKKIVTYQEGKKSLQVYVADIDWIPEQINVNGNFNGVAVVNLKQPV